MHLLSPKTFGCAVAAVVLSLALSSHSLFAGLITTRIDLSGEDPQELVVGQTLDVTVTLDGIEPSTPALWLNSVQLSDTFGAPINFSFGGPGLQLSGGLAGFVSPAANLKALGFDGSTLSLIGLGLFQPQFSFQTQVIAEGAGFIHLSGAVLPLVPFGSNAINAGSATLVTFATSGSGSTTPNPPSAPLPTAAAPEPSSFAIFAAMSFAVACRRRRDSRSAS
ncbi:hypothetical protein Mal15_40790 [Stieleria maiorica]|uniref:PEP-CTERM protein-sorting domain-containing protein n=1 Tax=Stieleria maiorica TaxID=2795974 RepID=A0A5B9MJ59_9BACT|nr:hypothetical protein [Stieleria maiorica]QEG00011.1 hypothetical protein Mal15_40790 [Stieleria maiorica]